MLGKGFECLNLRSFAAHLMLNSLFKASLPCTLVHSKYVDSNMGVLQSKLRLC